MKTSLLYWDYQEYEKELIATFPELIDRQLLTWIGVGGFIGAILMLSQPESVGGKMLLRKLSTSKFGSKLASLAFKYGPNRVVRASGDGPVKVSSLAAAKRAGLTIHNAFRENMFYIAAGLMSDADSLRDLLDLANQKVRTPPLVARRANAMGSYILALYNQTASDSMNMFAAPGEGVSWTVSYDDVLKALWMVRSYANFEKSQEQIERSGQLEYLFASLCGLLRVGFEDSRRITISQFNETEEGCFGGLKPEAYDALGVISFMASRFDETLQASPLSETRNSMVIAWANGLLMKTGARNLKMFVRPLVKAADYLDFVEVLE
jgi:hypothetical protein